MPGPFGQGPSSFLEIMDPRRMCLHVGDSCFFFQDLGGLSVTGVMKMLQVGLRWPRLGTSVCLSRFEPLLWGDLAVFVHIIWVICVFHWAGVIKLSILEGSNNTNVWYF